MLPGQILATVVVVPVEQAAREPVCHGGDSTRIQVCR